jgi:hypothetical protein
MPTIHDRNKLYIPDGKRKPDASAKARQLASMDARERQKRVRMPIVSFQMRRFWWELK